MPRSHNRKSAENFLLTTLKTATIQDNRVEPGAGTREQRERGRGTEAEDSSRAE